MISAKGMKMIGAVLDSRKKQEWQVFFDTEDGWSYEDPTDPEGHRFRINNARTADVLDSEPTSMVKTITIGGVSETGILLPDQGKFYALLG